MVSIADEQLIPLNDVPRRLPRRSNGRRIHIATIYRWAQRGCRGVRLETVQVGGTKYTSPEALQRFFDRLGPDGGPDAPSGADRSPSESRRHVDQTLRELGL
ncbi:MAG: DUF1580 domain-containing protein [Phycisphaerales bacterium]|nr:DUF1580 domain-containing protein [Phycisphaerales bacterium]